MKQMDLILGRHKTLMTPSTVSFVA